MTVGSGACVSGKRRIDGFLMAYFGWGADVLQALLLVEVDVSDEEEGMDVLLTIRSLMRALRSEN